METDFPLTEPEVETLRAGLAEKILALHDVEEEAVRVLIEAMG
jgi:hypothetical protein